MNRMWKITVLMLTAMLQMTAVYGKDAHPPAEEKEEGCELYSEKDLRLAGASPDAGRVEVFHNLEWGTLCGKPTMEISKVLCKQLGFGRAIGVFSIAPKKETSNWLSAIECKGDEGSIFDCSHSEWGSGPGCSETQPPLAVRCEAAGLDNVEAIPRSELILPGVDPETVLETYKPQHSKKCGRLSGLYPFQPNQTAAFVYKEKIQTWLSDRTGRLEEVMCRDPERNTANVEEFPDLRWNPYGFDFPFDSSKVRGDKILHSEKAKVLREGYLSPNAKVFWSLDHPHRHPEELPEMSDASKAIFHNLSRDGFVKIDDWGLDMDALRKTADWALSQREQKNVTVVLDDGAVIMARPHVPALDALLNNETVNAAIRAYLGQDSVLHGYKILRLSKRLQGADNYIAADWHHDRAGRRLKLFIFLHDVENFGGRPTEVANRTHNLVYWHFEDYFTSRYDNEYVQKNFDIHQLGGPRGGGFIFDTNAIHRGSPFGNKMRETIILEYHNEYKCPAIHSLGLNVPCPSGDQYMAYHKL
mmetsp:Transcript_2212/g.3511  ORF Transcript_2212/g.3511 Transcript_2212/m.3511 type:complete len:529 (+) Transcript_2212:119-1705(+)